MTKDILDRNEVRICVEQLRRHGMAKLMTGDANINLFSVMFQPFLNAANRYGLTSMTTLLNEEELLAFRAASHLEIIYDAVESVVAEVDNTILATLALVYEKLPATKVKGTQSYL